MKIQFEDMFIEFNESERTWTERLEEFMGALTAAGYNCPKNLEELEAYYQE